MAGSRDPGDNKPPSPDDPFIPTWLQPLPQPEVHEGGESLWEEWHEAAREFDAAFRATEPSRPVPLSPGPGTPSAAPQRGRITLDELVARARENNRVCPHQAHWMRLYQQLAGPDAMDLPPPPLEIWRKLSGLQKRLFFREYLEWADRHAGLGLMARFLDGLAEADWLHMGES